MLAVFKWLQSCSNLIIVRQSTRHLIRQSLPHRIRAEVADTRIGGICYCMGYLAFCEVPPEANMLHGEDRSRIVKMVVAHR